MKKTFIISLILSGHFLFSQNLENIGKIKLDYSIGGSSWGKNGIYSKSEVIELIKTENGDFEIIKYLKICNKAHNKIFTKDTTSLKTSKYKTIPKNEVENLFIELNTNRDNFTEEFLIKNFTKPSKKDILKIAKQNDEKEVFVNNYETKEDIENNYLEIQNFKYLSEFLNIYKSNIERFLITVDAWNVLKIVTYKNDEVKMYDFRFIENCGQPISVNNIEILNEKQNKFNFIKNTEFKIINMNVNLLLHKIVPEKSMTSKIIDLNNIRNEYVIWHLKNKS